ncbi:sulfotransferase family protein [Catenuloplanes sp. NPDC051500]|uniref:sulfotransferase family protein n=1 Tax=Catenuloplanes sp. NPDC051500 TaxID=3363959 RepID=UPI0037A2B2FC
MARVLFLGGLGRSGTTLVERLLGELPGICALGEVVHLWQRDLRDDERCGCGLRFSVCEFWQEIGEAAFGGWGHVDVDRITRLRATVERTRHIPRLAGKTLPSGLREAVVEYTSFYTAVYEAAALVSGARVIVDSSKHSALAHCLRWAPALDLRVAHVVRDPRGVAYSWTKSVDRPETDGAEQMTRYSAGRSALLWTGHNAAFGLLARRGVPTVRLRYEHLLEDPHAELRRLATHADLPVRDEDLAFVSTDAAQLRTGHSAAGNPMRFTVGRVPLRRDDAWRQALPPRQRALVGAVCAPMLHKYGYKEIS